MLKQIILDTDIGSDIDDAYALILALNSPEIKVMAAVTNNSNTKRKTEIIRAFDNNIPIFYGIETKKGVLTTSIGKKETRAKSLIENIDFFKNKDLTYISIGALSNLAFFLDKGIKFKEVIIMGGSINTSYSGEKKKIKEWNFNCDLESTKKVLKSNLPILLIPLDATWDLELNEENLNKIKESNKESSLLLNKHLLETREFLFKNYNIISKKPVLHDPLAVCAAFNNSFFEIEKIKVSLSEEGILEKGKEGKEISIVKNVKKEFINFFIDRII